MAQRFWSHGAALEKERSIRRTCLRCRSYWSECAGSRSQLAHSGARHVVAFSSTIALLKKSNSPPSAFLTRSRRCRRLAAVQFHIDTIPILIAEFSCLSEEQVLTRVHTLEARPSGPFPRENVPDTKLILHWREITMSSKKVLELTLLRAIAVLATIL